MYFLPQKELSCNNELRITLFHYKTSVSIKTYRCYGTLKFNQTFTETKILEKFKVWLFFFFEEKKFRGEKKSYLEL